ncbi:NAD-dependent epimerase [Lachnoclostridium sp. An131]|uniref:NAD-dependent epimerase/dehydratase family protein n=1 Tax=Lachnoclostridium sp. An131 TaxID=1965555 RepID=UPI000B38864B|nr:NAD-dependent epimerase/dehydratase family protein [Lachnoclostridium sp. An131]OUQ27977.1 NAD-dependent epimerase [Lachnoclostridium sp. An131]
MKKVLITGANSYIGTSFEAWAKEKYPEEFEIDTIDMVDGSWRETSFAGYDAVFHVAGIAHADVGHVSEERKAFYYKINRDLAIETAQKAKRDGVKQFVFMSSMIVYGESAGLGKRKVVTRNTKPHPANFYGDSKWQADKGVRKLADDSFHVAVLRPPMIYGKGSKGNYPLLAKMARKLPVFPDIQNERSMLYIGNLCEFLCLLMKSGDGGIYFPQNAEYVRTSEMVRLIAKTAGHRIWITRLLNPAVWVAGKISGKVSGMVNKAFGNMTYDMTMSQAFEGKYRCVSLVRSIHLTEGKVK